METVRLPEKLEPLFSPARYKVIRGGRGSAKSWSVARALIVKCLERKTHVLCAREFQSAIRDSVHKLLSTQIELLGFRQFFDIQRDVIYGPNGSQFVFVGLSDKTAESLKSYEDFDICWVEEGQVVSERSWRLLTPTIRRPGSEIWITFNPELDTDPTWVQFVENAAPGTFGVEMNWRDNPWFNEVLEAERVHAKATLSEIDYENIWEGKCRPAATGAIYTPEMTALIGSQRVNHFPPDPLLQVHTVWDLGFNDSCAIIFVQRHLSELRLVDYLEANQRTLAQYVTELDKRGYRYGTDFLPWDGADSKYKLTGDGTAPESILRKMGRRVQIVPQIDVELGIKKARLIFPRCYFDRDKTLRLRECLKRYRRSIPTSTNEPTNPMHDEFSHGADAFRYLAVIADKIVDTNSHRAPINYPKRAYA